MIRKLELEEAKGFEVAISVLETLGATVIPNVALLAEELWNATTKLQRMKLKRAAFPSSMAAYLETLPTNPRGLRTLQDLINHTKTDPDEDYPNYNVESFEIATSHNPESCEFKELEAIRDFVRGDGGLQAAMDRNQLDQLVTPTCSDAPVSFAGLESSPVISIPLGFYGPNKAVKKDSNGDLVTIGPGIP